MNAIIDHTQQTRVVEKPWGKAEQYTQNMSSTVKVITVQPGGALSLQYYHLRDELWVVLDAGAKIELGHRVIQPQIGDRILIPCMTTHRLSATGDRPVRILEISLGEFEENDIVRLEDIYGRAISVDDAPSTQSLDSVL